MYPVPVPVPVPMQFRLYLPLCIRNPFTRFIAFIRIQKLNEALHSIIWFRFLSYLLEQACLHWYVLNIDLSLGFIIFLLARNFLIPVMQGMSCTSPCHLISYFVSLLAHGVVEFYF